MQKGLGNGIQGKVTKIMGPGQSAPLNHGTWTRETTQPWDLDKVGHLIMEPGQACIKGPGCVLRRRASH
jgi:hypothetical protein